MPVDERSKNPERSEERCDGKVRRSRLTYHAPNTSKFNRGRQTAGANVRRREGNNPDHQKGSVIADKSGRPARKI